MSLVYDCFLFFNELETLEIRLNVLSEVVDKFVLVEADKTFSFKNKPFYFEENKKRYSQFLDRIIHVKINEYPQTNDTWEMQRFQRNQIALGLNKCSLNDIILISDLDEIPNPEAIIAFQNSGLGLCKFKQLHFAYFLNYQRCGFNKFWYPAKIAYYKHILENNLTPQMIRSKMDIPIIKDAGWHFSFLGGLENIKYKIKSISRQEWNNEKYLNDRQIEYKIRMGLDLFNRKGRHLIPVKISNKKHPKYIIDNQEKYTHLIYPHISRYVIIKNTLLCLPFVIKDKISQFAKFILPKNIVQKIKDSKKRKNF